MASNRTVRVSSSVGSKDVPSFSRKSFEKNLGSHYERETLQDKQAFKKAKKDLFEEVDVKNKGWGMMFGDIEVIDASVYMSKPAGSAGAAASEEEGDGEEVSCDSDQSDGGEDDENSDTEAMEVAANTAATTTKSAPKGKEKENEKVAAQGAQPAVDPLTAKITTLTTLNNILAKHDATQTLTATWSTNVSGYELPPLVAYNFHRLNYHYPLPIQASTLPAALLGRRDIVGCAPTGSGKTLCYGLSCIAGILSNLANETETGTRALILTPTRELAIQVQKELQEYTKFPADDLVRRNEGKNKKKANERFAKNFPTKTVIRVAAILGGLAEEKQLRLLGINPEIIVATPGRLWELMSSEEHSSMIDLTKLKYLVVDEADRMVKQGNFPELERIFGVINKEKEESDSEEEGSEEEEDENDAEEEEEEEEDNAENDVEEMSEKEIQAFLGFTDEHKTVSLSDDVLKRIEEQKNLPKSAYKTARAEPLPKPKKGKEVKGQRQTFIYSATLTLPQVSDKKDKNKNKRKRKQASNDPLQDSVLSDILYKAGSKGTVKVIDLTSANDAAGVTDSKQIEADEKKTGKKEEKRLQLPSGLTLFQTRCAQLHKDSFTYAFLSTTQEGSNGPAVVFCNSIAGVRRVHATLEALGMPVKMLHAELTQVSVFHPSPFLADATAMTKTTKFPDMECCKMQTLNTSLPWGQIVNNLQATLPLPTNATVFCSAPHSLTHLSLSFHRKHA
jgi:ATP-dependent RNA helicase DDX24/MAK5